MIPGFWGMRSLGKHTYFSCSGLVLPSTQPDRQQNAAAELGLLLGFEGYNVPEWPFLFGCRPPVGLLLPLSKANYQGYYNVGPGLPCTHRFFLGISPFILQLIFVLVLQKSDK